MRQYIVSKSAVTSDDMTIPANTTHPPNVYPTLAHRIRRWPSIGQTLGRCVVLAGMSMLLTATNSSYNPAETRIEIWYVALMLDQRRRRWLSIKTTVD